MPTSVYQPAHRRRARRRPLLERRWPRRVLITANLVVASTLVLSGMAYGYVRYRIDAIHTVAVKNLTPEGKATANGLAPENVLLIGNQSRACLLSNQIGSPGQFGNPADLSGSLSDVIMVLHLDPRTRTAGVLSIPRDLFEAMPPGTPSGPYEKIDAALNDGANGPANLITALQDDLGIAVNHYVEVNFCGFEQTVNALGGIKMDFPEPLYDQEAQLHITRTGCQLISGATALALVRSRHLQYDPPGVSVSDTAAWPSDPESDLARITRDHTFLRVLIDTAQSQGISDPIRLNSFVSALTNQVTMDPGLRNKLISLSGTYRHVTAGNLPETTLPVTTVSNYSYDGYHLGDVDFAVEPQDDQVIAAWDRSALPAPQAPGAVQVFNAVGSAHLAADTGTALRAAGLNVTTESDVPVLGTPSETLVRYHQGQIAQGVAVMQRFAGAVTMYPDAKVPAGQVWVDVGTTEAVLTAAPASPSAPGSASRSASSGSAAASAPSSSSPPSVPTVGGQRPSASSDNLTAYDPRPC